MFLPPDLYLSLLMANPQRKISKRNRLDSLWIGVGMREWPFKVWAWMDNGENVLSHSFTAIIKVWCYSICCVHGAQGSKQEPKTPQGLGQERGGEVGWGHVCKRLGNSLASRRGKLRQIVRQTPNNLQPSTKWQDLTFPNQGHLGANDLPNPDLATAELPQSWFLSGNIQWR